MTLTCCHGTSGSSRWRNVGSSPGTLTRAASSLMSTSGEDPSRPHGTPPRGTPSPGPRRGPRRKSLHARRGGRDVIERDYTEPIDDVADGVPRWRVGAGTGTV